MLCLGAIPPNWFRGIFSWYRLLIVHALCLFPDDQIYFARLRIALQHNMKNGDAKAWLSCLFERLVEDHPEFKNMMNASAPPNSCSLVAPVEQLSGESDYVEPLWNKSADNLPVSCSASTQDVTDVEDHTPQLSWSKSYCVPDFLIYMDSYPGLFPLVIEVKGLGEDGTNENLMKMLSKLHFQDVVLGIMITPIKYILTAIIKTEKELHIVKADWDIDLCRTKMVTEKPVPLNVDSIHTLHKYVSSVLQWASKTRCKLD